MHVTQHAPTMHDDMAAYERLADTGIAHLLEHMAFKGSQRIGTRDYSAEAPLLAAVDEGALACS